MLAKRLTKKRGVGADDVDARARTRRRSACRRRPAPRGSGGRRASCGCRGGPPWPCPRAGGPADRPGRRSAWAGRAGARAACRAKRTARDRACRIALRARSTKARGTENAPAAGGGGCGVCAARTGRPAPSPTCQTTSSGGTCVERPAPRAASRQPSKSSSAASVTTRMPRQPASGHAGFIRTVPAAWPSARPAVRTSSCRPAPPGASRSRSGTGAPWRSTRSAARRRRAAAAASGARRGSRRPPCTPSPGTRSSISRGARLTSTGKCSRNLSAQASFGSMSSGSMPVVVGGVGDLLRAEIVEAHQPVGLVEPVLAHQRRALERQHRAGVGDRAEGRIIDAAQVEPVVEPAAFGHDVAVGRGVGADDHLGRLAGRREARAPTCSASSRRRCR